MKINIAKSAGFCFGVTRAIEIALKTANSGKHVEMLGDIVHNDHVVKEIKKNGIKKINYLGNGKGKNLLIRAHGASLQTYKKARKLGYAIIDATCPMVKEIHNIVSKFEKQNIPVIVIGDKHHDEVKGIVGQLKKPAFVIDPSLTLPKTKLQKLKKCAIVCQSTQNIEKVNILINAIKKIVPIVHFVNTICRPTRTKQEEIKTLPLSNDVIIVIGSKSSANTKRLYQLSKQLNPKTYWINQASEIKKDWFKNAKSIGITAGASTPQSSISAVVTKLKHL